MFGGAERRMSFHRVRVNPHGLMVAVAMELSPLPFAFAALALLALALLALALAALLLCAALLSIVRGWMLGV